MEKRPDPLIFVTSTQSPDRMDFTDVIALLEQYEVAQTELAYGYRFGGEPQEFTKFGPRFIQLAQPPARLEAIKACVQHLGCLAAEFNTLDKSITTLLQAEMTAKIEFETLRIRRDYALQWPALELDIHSQPVELAAYTLDSASYATQQALTARQSILSLVSNHYPGVDLQKPETFAAAAADRVENVWCEHYQQVEIIEFQKRLDLPDTALAAEAKRSV